MASHTPTEQEIARVNGIFTYRAPHGDQAERYVAIRKRASELASDLLVKCPSSRELSLALTKIEECVMWANAAIARNEKETGS